MLNTRKIKALPREIFQQLGWDFFLPEHIGEYIMPELLKVTTAERNAYYDAANELYDMLVEAAQHVIDKKLYKELDIPENMVKLIEMTWDDDRNLHLFGRFDFAGGVDGLPIKMLEFNADTPSSLPETAIIQWAQLRANNIDESLQFNFVYDAMVENFTRLREENEDLAPHLLVSTMPDAPEDDLNVSILMEAAREAGFEVEFCGIEDVTFSDEEGIFTQDEEGNYNRHEFWFKLIPWEMMATEEPDLIAQLTNIVKKRKAVIINPAYTLLMQSKGILKYLWDLYPDHELLLKTTFTEPTHNLGYVRKAILGREGSNVSIYDILGDMVEATPGEYAEQKVVYQTLAKLNEDNSGYHYQAGVFFAWEGCGLGFRRNQSRIIDNAAQFIGHYTDEEPKDTKSRARFF
jgi:glutathionylspermidine synthase